MKFQKKSYHLALRHTMGLTLIEMMIGIGLAGIVIYIVSQILVRTNQADLRDVARESAKNSNLEILSLINRDMKFQTAFNVSTDGRTLSITRKKKYQVGVPDSTYVVTYNTSCASIASAPPAIQSIFTKLYSGTNDGVLSATQNKCLRSYNCKSGTFPQIKITLSTSGTNVPTYNRVEFPKISTSIKLESSGSGLCFINLGTKIRVVAESAFIIDKSTAILNVVTDELILTPGSKSTVDLLP